MLRIELLIEGVDRGVLVDADLTTSDPHVHAIGDCAQPPGGASGLVAQGWEQARRLADRLTGRDPDRLAEERLAVLQAGPDVVRLAPSLIIDEADIDEGLDRFERAIATLTQA